MVELRRLAMAFTVTISGMLLTVGVTRAHDGAEHASHAIEGVGGLGGPLAVVLATGIVYWLTNREERRSASPGSVSDSRSALSTATITETESRAPAPENP